MNDKRKINEEIINKWNELFSKFVEFRTRHHPVCKTGNTIGSTATRAAGKTSVKYSFTFNILIYIKFKTTFNTSNPKESNREL
jgi:hypothetical protein